MVVRRFDQILVGPKLELSKTLQEGCNRKEHLKGSRMMHTVFQFHSIFQSGVKGGVNTHTHTHTGMLYGADLLPQRDLGQEVHTAVQCSIETAAKVPQEPPTLKRA